MVLSQWLLTLWSDGHEPCHISEEKASPSVTGFLYSDFTALYYGLMSENVVDSVKHHKNRPDLLTVSNTDVSFPEFTESWVLTLVKVSLTDSHLFRAQEQ